MLSNAPGPHYYGGDSNSFLRGAPAVAARTVGTTGSHWHGISGGTSMMHHGHAVSMGGGSGGSGGGAGGGGGGYGMPQNGNIGQGPGTGDTAGRYMSLNELNPDKKKGPTWISLNPNMIKDIVMYLSNHPVVNACVGAIFKPLFQMGLRTKHRQRHILPIYRRILEREWLSPAKEATRSVMDIGVYAVRISPHQDIVGLPNVLSYVLHTFQFYITDYDRYIWRVIRNSDGKELKDVFVREVFRPTPTGHLTSPMSQLLGDIYREKFLFDTFAFAVWHRAHPLVVLEKQQPRNVLSLEERMTAAQRTADQPNPQGVLAASMNSARNWDEFQRQQMVQGINKEGALLNPEQTKARIQQTQAMATRSHVIEYEPQLNRTILKTMNDHIYKQPTLPESPAHLMEMLQNIESIAAKVFQVPRDRFGEQYTRYKSNENIVNDIFETTIHFWANIIDGDFLPLFCYEIYGGEEAIRRAKHIERRINQKAEKKRARKQAKLEKKQQKQDKQKNRVMLEQQQQDETQKQQGQHGQVAASYNTGRGGAAGLASAGHQHHHHNQSVTSMASVDTIHTNVVLPIDNDNNTSGVTELENAATDNTQSVLSLASKSTIAPSNAGTRPVRGSAAVSGGAAPGSQHAVARKIDIGLAHAESHVKNKSTKSQRKMDTDDDTSDDDTDSSTVTDVTDDETRRTKSRRKRQLKKEKKKQKKQEKRANKKRQKKQTSKKKPTIKETRLEKKKAQDLDRQRRLGSLVHSWVDEDDSGSSGAEFDTSDEDAEDMNLTIRLQWSVDRERKQAAAKAGVPGAVLQTKDQITLAIEGINERLNALQSGQVLNANGQVVGANGEPVDVNGKKHHTHRPTDLDGDMYLEGVRGEGRRGRKLGKDGKPAPASSSNTAEPTISALPGPGYGVPTSEEVQAEMERRKQDRDSIWIDDGHGHPVTYANTSGSGSASGSGSSGTGSGSSASTSKTSQGGSGSGSGLTPSDIGSAAQDEESKAKAISDEKESKAKSEKLEQLRQEHVRIDQEYHDTIASGNLTTKEEISQALSKRNETHRQVEEKFAAESKSQLKERELALAKELASIEGRYHAELKAAPDARTRQNALRRYDEATALAVHAHSNTDVKAVDKYNLERRRIHAEFDKEQKIMADKLAKDMSASAADKRLQATIINQHNRTTIQLEKDKRRDLARAAKERDAIAEEKKHQDQDPEYRRIQEQRLAAAERRQEIEEERAARGRQGRAEQGRAAPVPPADRGHDARQSHVQAELPADEDDQKSEKKQRKSKTAKSDESEMDESEDKEAKGSKDAKDASEGKTTKSSKSTENKNGKESKSKTRDKDAKSDDASDKDDGDKTARSKKKRKSVDDDNEDEDEGDTADDESEQEKSKTRQKKKQKTGKHKASAKDASKNDDD